MPRLACCSCITRMCWGATAAAAVLLGGCGAFGLPDLVLPALARQGAAAQPRRPGGPAQLLQRCAGARADAGADQSVAAVPSAHNRRARQVHATLLCSLLLADALG